MGHIGRHNGVDYKHQRICDVLMVKITTRWYFTYGLDGKPTSNHYSTLAQMRDAIDCGEFDENPTQKRKKSE